MTNSLPEIQVWQIGVIVRDLKKTMAGYHAALGWGPWNVFEFRPPLNHDTELRGEPVEYGMRVAEVQVGPIAFELIEPLEGESIYQEFLDQHGEGLHHLALRHESTDYEQTLEKFRALGMDVLMGGKIGDSLRYYYVDSEPLLKVVFEGGEGGPLQPDWVYPEP